MHFLSLSILVTVCSYALFGMHQSQDKVPGEYLAEMQILGEKLATPNTNHEFLVQFAGVWDTSTSIMGMEPTLGTATYKMILGNRYLDGTHDGNFMGIPFEGRLTIGYDNYKHKFLASYIDNLGTSMRPAEGMLNRKGNLLSLWGTMDEWMTDEHDKPVKYTYACIDNNHFVFEVHDLALGEQSKVITVTYTRQTK